MRILVTGGAGFIGSYIIDRLIKDGHTVRIYDNLDPQVHPGGRRPAYLNKEAEFVKGDVRDREGFKKALKDMEVVFHEAACVGVGQSQYEIKRYSDVNIGGTANLFDILVKERQKVKKVLIAASMSSYGEGAYRCPGCGPVDFEKREEKDLKKRDWELHCGHCHEDLIAIPTAEDKKRDCYSIYALTKKIQEDMAAIFSKTYDFPVIALRYFNAYGPRQSLSNPYTGVCAIFISRLRSNHRPIIYEDGRQSRDFISVYDLARANVLAMVRIKKGFRAYNVGSGKPKTVLGIAEELGKYLGSSLRPRITYRYRKGDIRHCYASTEKIKKELGFEPRVDFRRGMEELIEWSGEVRVIDKFDKMEKELSEKGLI